MVESSLGLLPKGHMLERSGQGLGQGPPCCSFLPLSLPPSLLSLINSPIRIFFSHWGANYEREEGSTLPGQGRAQESWGLGGEQTHDGRKLHGPLSVLLGPFTSPGPDADQLCRVRREGRPVLPQRPARHRVQEMALFSAWVPFLFSATMLTLNIFLEVYLFSFSFLPG